MTRKAVAGAKVSGIAVAAAAALVTLAAGPKPAAATLLEPVQYSDRGLPGGRESLFEPPRLRQPRSLLRPRAQSRGPHYEPPPVVYEPPPVTYRPPSVAEHSGRGRCAPRTRAWHAYCSARFRSFDPSRGTYTTHSGQERPCRCP